MHYSVMLKEAIEYLNLKEDGIYIDATLGLGGHSKEILKRIKKGYLYAFDSDLNSIPIAKENLTKVGNNFKIFHSNFVNLKEVLKNEKVDGILFDLGVSSPQIDNENRGFSFMHDGELDMRMDQSQKISAKDVVNNYSKNELTNIFYKYGEEDKSKIIAEHIVKKRNELPINTTKELVDVILSSVGANYFYKKHPERKIFQAIRIEVNNELKVLESVLPEAIDMLKPNGRIVVITFHSLEDKIVKRIFKEFSEVDDLVKGLPSIPESYQPKIKIITKKPILPTEEEIKINSRSKSSKLRVIERC